MFAVILLPPALAVGGNRRHTLQKRIGKALIILLPQQLTALIYENYPFFNGLTHLPSSPTFVALRIFFFDGPTFSFIAPRFTSLESSQNLSRPPHLQFHKILNFAFRLPVGIKAQLMRSAQSFRDFLIYTCCHLSFPNFKFDVFQCNVNLSHVFSFALAAFSSCFAFCFMLLSL